MGVIAQDLQKSLPIAVGKVPERRWVAANGTTQVTKNTLLVRESYILMAGIGALQHLMSNYEELSEIWTNDRQIVILINYFWNCFVLFRLIYYIFGLNCYLYLFYR